MKVALVGFLTDSYLVNFKKKLVEKCQSKIFKTSDTVQ